MDEHNDNIPAAIPTTVEHVTYRSRLEARWAVYLKLLGFQHVQYEPFDLRNYVPDLLVVTGRSRILLEVKPVSLDADVDQHVQRARRAGWRGRFGVLGYEVRSCDPLSDGGDLAIGHASVGHGPLRRLDLWYDDVDERWKLVRGGRPWMRPSKRAVERGIELWHAAGAAVQWKPPA